MPFPFHDPYPVLLSLDVGMGDSLDSAISDARVAFPARDPGQLAVSIACVDDPAGVAYGGVNDGDNYYSASLLKVAALYAAYELLASVNSVASSLGALDSDELHGQLRTMDPVIDAAVPAITAAPGVDQLMRVPKYKEIISVVQLVDGGVTAFFNAFFLSHLHEAIVKSSNADAGACIKALGYSWINGALAGGDFCTDGTGIWLAGTFLGDRNLNPGDASLWPYVRTSSVNDGPVAQATTTFGMANLYAHLMAGSLVDEDSSTRMLQLLAETQAGDEPSWMDKRRKGNVPTSFTITHTKIGTGPLKSDISSLSEASIVQHTTSGRRFIVVWQNARDADVRLVTFIVDRAIQGFVAL